MARESIERWFEKRQEIGGLTAEPSEEPIKEPWVVDPNSPEMVRRTDGRFFRLVAVDVRNAVTREVASWQQPMLHSLETQTIGDKAIEGFVALFKRIEYGKAQYLVQAKAEPGNDLLNGVALAPTIQASYSNVLKHPDKVPLFEHLDTRDEEKVQWAIQPKDGGRFYKKNTLLVRRDLKPTEKVPVPETHIWATRGAIRDLQRKGYANEHLNEVFGALFW